MSDSKQVSVGESLDQVLKDRQSCRAFRPSPVPRATIEKILSMAQRSPSWNNTQPWQVIIVSGEATDRFRTALYDWLLTKPKSDPDIPWPREYLGVYQARRRECGFMLYDAVGIRRGDKTAYMHQSMENHRFFGAPHVALITTDEPMGIYGAIDCGAYVHGFMLAAQAQGVATIAQASLAHQSQFVRNYFDIPDDRLLVCGISFGYADWDHPLNQYRTTRAELGEVVRFVD